MSLLDILPTFSSLAGTEDEILATDGTSLLPCLSGHPLTSRQIAAEYLSEGVFEPTFTLIQDRMKLFYSETDPPLLFDLESDPNELTNLVKDQSYAGALQHLTDVAKQLWNAEDLKAKIIADQNRRRLISRAHSIGAAPVWDYQPMTDASQQYVRAGKWTVEVEAEAHLDLPQSRKSPSD